MALNKLTADALVDGTLDADAIGPASITTAKLNSNIISGQTAIGTVDVSNDLLLIYDADATSLKKVPVSSVGATNTDGLTEGSSNLYYTNARADARAQLKIDALVDSAPGTLDTLNELAAALGDDANFSTTVTNSIATKLNLTGGTLTGTLTVNEGGGYYANIGRGNSTPGGTDPWLGLFNNSNIANATYGWGMYDSTADGSFQIWNKNNSTTGYNALTIKRGGNVGIGTASPTHMLEIKSSGNAGQDFIKVLDSDNNQQFRIYSDSSTGEPVLRIYDTSGSAKIVLHANGVSRFEGGNVGIGTASPQQLLHVNGGAADTTIQITNSVSGSAATDGFSLTVENPSGDVNIRNREATNMRFYTGNVERIRIDSSGRFGIATGGAVETNAHANADDLVIGNTSNRTGMTIVSDPAQNGNIHFSDGTSTGNANIKGQLTYEHSDNSFRFYANSTIEVLRLTSSGGTVFNNGQDINQNFAVKASGNANALFIDGNGGKVGIGTNNPGEKLEVDGIVQIKRASDHPAMRFMEGSDTRAYFGSGDWAINGLADADFGISSGAGKLVLGTTFGNARMTIDASGNVGIGSASPTAKFNVAGATSGDYLAKIESTNQFGLKIKTTSTSDSHEQLAIHDGANNIKFKVMGGGTVHATGINIGGSGAANRLDDYEEGTWTPGIDGLTNTPNFYNLTGRYTKIGRQVTIQYFAQTANSPAPTFSSITAEFKVTGLPFAVLSNGYTGSQGSVNAQSFSYHGTYNTQGVVGSGTNGGCYLTCNVVSSQHLQFQVTNSGGIRGIVNNRGANLGFIIEATCTYFTT